MATMGNLISQLQRLIAKGLISTEVQPLLKTQKGHLFGFAFMTAPTTVLTAVTNGFITAFAPGALVFSIHSAAALSVRIVINTGTPSAPTWTGLVS